jgi:hypothetical protein
MPSKPKRTPSPRSKPAVQRKPRRSKPPPEPVEAVAPPPPPPPPPLTVPQPPVATSRWTVGAALVAVFVALGLVLAVFGALRLLGGGGGLTLEDGVPTEASVPDLQGLASPERPVYWIGPPASGRLEVTKTSRDAVYVRYLPAGVELGDRRPRYTTIATYTSANAYSELLGSQRSKGMKSERVPGGGLAVWRTSPGTSVYVAYPRVKYLVEVFDPSAVRARALALGSLQPVG